MSQYPRGKNPICYDKTSLDATPLDFSYKELKQLSDIKYKDQRKGRRKTPLKMQLEVKDDKKNQLAKQEEEKAAKKDQNNEEEEDEENEDQEEEENGKESNDKEKQDDKKKQEVTGPEVIRAIPSTNIKDVITSHGVQMSLMAQKSQGGKNQPNSNNLIQKKVFKVKKIQTTILLGYNQIPNLDNFFSIVDAVMFDCKQLRWIDLSHNHLVNLTYDFSEFQFLTILYLHCNYLYQLKDLLILEKVPLKELTIHGNPIDTIPNFRLYIIGILPYLKKLDTVLVSKKERDNCRVWIECFKLVSLPSVKDPVKPESQLNLISDQSQI